MKIYDKDYSYVSNGENSKFLIDGKDGSEKRGQSFYKYYPLNDNSVDALTHLYVYATHPNQFNDPFDCATNLIKFDDVECIQELWRPIYQEVVAFCKDDKEELFKFTNEAYKTYLYMKCGVLCLSDNYNDLSMWSAYTNHIGFCLEFDIFSFPSVWIGPFSINYQTELKQHSIKDISLQLATIVQTNVKQECWKHEKEWRLLLECPQDDYMEPYGKFSSMFKDDMPNFHDRKFKYPLKSLKGVTLGLNFLNGLLDISDYEKEFTTKDNLHNDVMSFLAITKIPTFVIHTIGFSIERQPISVYQIRKNVYRVIISSK